jgi:hypothetical protein
MSSDIKPTFFITLAFVILTCGVVYFQDVYFGLSLLGFAVVSYLQNMCYTWSSRSRNSGDPDYHRLAAWTSNGVYQLQRVVSVGVLFEPILAWRSGVGDPVDMVIKVFIGITAYTLITTEGSVKGMKLLIKKEQGKRKLMTQDELEARIRVLEDRKRWQEFIERTSDD